MPKPAADEDHDDGLDKELHHDVARLGAHSFAYADFAGALADGHQHDVHHAQVRRETAS